MTLPTLDIENGLCSGGARAVAGVDEVGRGSWAGPIVAAAVVLPLYDASLQTLLCGVRDSKELLPRRRSELLRTIRVVATGIGVGWCTRRCIDEIGIAEANRRAMTLAVRRLRPAPDALILDHLRLSALTVPQVAIPRADSLSLSVAAASIVAKVVRDNLMDWCDLRYPGYGFAAHKGYGTASHREALHRLGPCNLHRRSFSPVAALVS